MSVSFLQNVIFLQCPLCEDRVPVTTLLAHLTSVFQCLLCAK